VEKLRKALAAREQEVAALLEKEKVLLARVDELQRAPVASDLETLLAGRGRHTHTHTHTHGHTHTHTHTEARKERDDVVLRMDQMAVELRKARMFAASQDYYIDRRLVANVLQVLHTHTHTHTHTHARTHTRTHARTPSRTYTHILQVLHDYIHTHNSLSLSHTHTLTHTHTCTSRSYMYTLTRTHTHIHTHLCTYVCV
jgi:hypothetical protein